MASADLRWRWWVKKKKYWLAQTDSLSFNLRPVHTLCLIGRIDFQEATHTTTSTDTDYVLGKRVLFIEGNRKPNKKRPLSPRKVSLCSLCCQLGFGLLHQWLYTQYTNYTIVSPFPLCGQQQCDGSKSVLRVNDRATTWPREKRTWR